MAFSLRERGHDGQITMLGAEPILPHQRSPHTKSLLVVPKPISECGAYDWASIEWFLGRFIVAKHPDARFVNLENHETAIAIFQISRA